MLHRCTVGSCSCCHGGSFTTSHHSPSPANSPSFSFLLSAPGSHNKQPIPSFNDPSDLDHSHVSNYNSPVDCTLSLGTPSTRSSSVYDTERRSSTAAAGSCMPNFCWDLLQPPKHDSSSVANSNSNGSSGGNNVCGSENDSLLARRCVNCDTTSTPLWRNGPRGPKSLCNACGIRFKKEERRAAAATTAGSGASGLPPSTAPHTFNSHSSWIHTHAATQSHKMTPPPATSRQQSVTSSSFPMTMEGPAKTRSYRFSRGALMCRTGRALCTTSQDESNFNLSSDLPSPISCRHSNDDLLVLISKK